MTRRGEGAAMRADLAVAHILARSDPDESLYVRLLAAIGEPLGWEFGAWWQVSAEDEALHCIETWRSGALAESDFESLSRRTVLARGEGLPGRVWATAEPAWVVDVTEDPNFPRAAGAELAGLRSAFAFPVHSSRGALGAIEMFANRAREPDAELLQTMASLGS